MEGGALSSAWLANWWDPHNVRFGMLLGYPGPALASFADAEADEPRWKQMEQVTIAAGLETVRTWRSR
jgi:hypothetical protein